MVKRFLSSSNHFYSHKDDVVTYKDLVDLIDRFFKGNFLYPLEWDNFVSWEHENPNIEQYRVKIAELEPLLVSGPKKNIELGRKKLLAIRDEIDSKALK
jgi:hypothetical protein